MFNNLNSTLKKVVVIFLIITLTYANLFLIGSNIVKGLFSYALEETEEQSMIIVNQELVMNKVYGEGEEQTRVVQVAVETGIEDEEYPIKSSTITLGTNLIEASLLDVKVTELNKNSYTTGTWELSEEGKVIISLVNENEELETKEKGLDKFLVTYVFEKSEIETIKKPLEGVDATTYKQEDFGFTCSESDFEDINVEKELLLLNIENRDIHKTTIDSGKVDYIETLNLDLSYRNDITNITIEDVSNDFYNIDGQENEDLVLQYKTTTISKESLINLLGENGKVVITDNATSKELITLTNEKLTKEESEKQYYGEAEEQELRSELSVLADEIVIEYSIDVTSLKIELVDIIPQSKTNIDISYFVIENRKSILNVNDIENLDYLQENVKYTVDEEKTVQSTINFKDTVTRASLTVDNTAWVVGEANTVNYTITLDTTTEKSELFVNPMFLIELPSSVESINTENSVFTVNNDGGVFTEKKVFTTTVLGKKYVVIILIGEQDLDSIQNGDTTVNLELELNVSADEIEGNEITKIYYQNDTVTTYENGSSFDTDEVEVSLILANEDKEEIFEEIPGADEEVDLGLNIDLQMKSSTKQILQAGETIEYTISLYNYDSKEVQDLVLTDILPENTTLSSVVDENAEEVTYDYNEEARIISINIDKIDGATEAIVDNEESGETETIIQSGSKIFKITVTTNELENEVYNKELINIAKVEKEGDTIEGHYVVKLDEAQVVNKLSKGILNVQIDQLPEQINEKEEIILVLKVENKGLIPVTDININVDLPQEVLPRYYEEYLVYGDGEQTSKTNSTLNSNLSLNIQEIPSETTHYLKLIGTVKDINENKQISIVGNVNKQEVIWTTELIDLDEKPEKPIEPDDPTNPDKPENPADPDNPEQPEEPNNPDNPNKPADPDHSESITDGFDLSLVQYLNKVTVENAEGTTTYEYTDTNFAKVEIHSKYMNGSKVTLEYKMIVKNEGTIPGYARKIVNYKPEGLEFNQDLNKEWYVGDDGNIYSVALLNKLLNPGETAELTIILTKQMTNEDGGTIKNIVEIYEATNDENVEDLNSIPGDKLEGQNDMSTVEIIVAVKTGKIILYITLATAVISIIGLGFYKIKKVTLNKKGGC